jgi:hypothetical protein
MVGSTDVGKQEQDPFTFNFCTEMQEGGGLEARKFWLVTSTQEKIAKSTFTNSSTFLQTARM